MLPNPLEPTSKIQGPVKTTAKMTSHGVIQISSLDNESATGADDVIGNTKVALFKHGLLVGNQLEGTSPEINLHAW